MLLVNNITTLSVGPFVFRIETNCIEVSRSIDLHYNQQSACLIDSEVDFTISIRRKSRNFVVVTINNIRSFEHVPLIHAALSLEWAMNHAVYQWMHRYLIVHSAALGCGDNAVLFPASSGSGKSTLSASLMLSGWRLYSDELAIIEGMELPAVHSYPKPVNLKNDAVSIVADKFPHAVFGDPILGTEKGDVRLLKHRFEPAGEAVPICGVVFVQWVNGATASLQSVSPKLAFERLLSHSVNYTLRRQAGFEQVCQIITGSKLYQLTYSDIDEGIASLNAEFNS